MKTVPHMFADLTALMEDLHGVSVEGQAPDATADMQEVFASNMEAGFVSAKWIVASIRRALLGAGQ